MAGKIKNNGTKIENGGSEILLSQIFYSPRFFNFSGDRRPVISGDIKLFDNNNLLTNRKVSRW